MRRIALAMAAISLSAVPAMAQQISLGTSPPGSFHNTTASVIAGVVDEHTDLSAVLQSFAAPSVYVPAVGSGEMDFGFANVIEAMLAFEGDEFYGGNPMPDMRVVTVTSPLRAGFFARSSSDMSEITDLAGHRVPTEFAQQQVIRILTSALINAAGMDESDLEGVPVPTASRNAEEFQAGNTDTMWFALGSGALNQVSATVGGIRLLSVPDTPEVTDRLRNSLPQAYIYQQEPEEGLVGVDATTGVLAWDALMLVHSSVDDDIVYEVTRALYENAEYIAGAAGTVSMFAREDMAKDLAPLEYHAGAIRFYEEQGLWPPQN